MDKMQKLHDKYGSMMSLCLVGWNTWDIWMADIKIIKEMLHDPRFASREATRLWLKQGFYKGLAFTGLKEARAKRKVMSQFLGSLGVGKSAFADGICAETEKLCKYLTGNTGEQISCRVSCQIFLFYEVPQRFLFFSENFRIRDKQHYNDTVVQQVVRI